MKIIQNNQTFDTRLEASDWRYSASILGLIKYFRYFNIPYSGYEENDFIEYNQCDIQEDKYFQFVEKYFEKDMHHKTIETMLKMEELSDSQVQLINDKLSANSVMKKIFGTLKFSLENKEEILQTIHLYREEIVRETYRNKKNLYAKFSNKGLLLKENQKICRLNGYYVDIGRKIKSISYGFNKDTYKSTDEKEFDFIPFAFTQSFEGLFINNNFTIRQLIETNEKLQQTLDDGKSLFERIKQTGDFIYFDVEVISKSQEKDYFESFYIRKYAIDLIQEIKNYRLIQFKYKISDKEYLDIEQVVIARILNNLALDDLIEILLIEKTGYDIRINQLIKINMMIYGGGSMNKGSAAAYACAKQVNEKIQANKANSYKQKLITAMVAHDYDRVCDILLQLSSYSNVVFNFAYDLFEDFERNKNIAYTFINTLNSKTKEEDKADDVKK